MTDRYFAQSPILADRAVLVGSEAHHLIHVMLARPGSRVTLIDGSGAEFSAQVQKLGRDEVVLAVLARCDVDRELPLELTLAVTLPKGDRQKWLVEKAVELGVGRIVPLVTARSVARPLQRTIDRLARTVVEASKQCGRNRLLTIDPPQGWADFVAATTNVPDRMLAHPISRPRGAEPLPTARLCGDNPPTRVLLAVGPEGGFSSQEATLAVAAGWQPIDLGPRILRVETAAILLVAMVTQRTL